jgi:hypothetical protein
VLYIGSFFATDSELKQVLLCLFAGFIVNQKYLQKNHGALCKGH